MQRKSRRTTKRRKRLETFGEIEEALDRMAGKEITTLKAIRELSWLAYQAQKILCRSRDISRRDRHCLSQAIEEVKTFSVSAVSGNWIDRFESAYENLRRSLILVSSRPCCYTCAYFVSFQESPSICNAFHEPKDSIETIDCPDWEQNDLLRRILPFNS